MRSFITGFLEGIGLIIAVIGMVMLLVIYPIWPSIFAVGIVLTVLGAVIMAPVWAIAFCLDERRKRKERERLNR